MKGGLHLPPIAEPQLDPICQRFSVHTVCSDRCRRGLAVHKALIRSRESVAVR